MNADVHKLLRYLIAGGLNTAFGYAAYAVLILAGAPIGLAVAGANILSFFFNFFSYGRLVFGQTSHRLLPRFLLVYISLAGVNIVMLQGLAAFGVGALLAQALLVPVLVSIGFVGMRLFVFTSSELANFRETLR
jgi:putative flippase GtrA